MPLRKTDKNLLLLLMANVLFFGLHIYANCENVYYFFQLTIIGQIVVILNFLLSILLHEKKSGRKVKLFLSRFHLLGLGLETVIALGFWSLRIFFSKGIIKQGEEYTPYTQFLSIYLHGGSYLTLFYFVKADQIVMETQKWKKYLIHLLWGIPFLFLQNLRWQLTGEHVYGFVKYLQWSQIIVFEVGLYLIAVGIDYVLTLRHGLKLSIKHMSKKHESFDDLQKQKQKLDKQQYESENENQKGE